MKKLFSLLFLLAGTVVGLSAQQLLPFQNTRFSPEVRAADLCSRLTLEEKVSLMMSDSKPVERLGIPGYNWWSECLHGAARAGMATVFPQSISMAASWDDELVEKVFDIASTEQRIKFILARQKNPMETPRYSGLCAWTPNINIFRDPRWGRGQETYGEDPWLTMKMGYSVVRGLQGRTEGARKLLADLGYYTPGTYPYDKLHACLKHYAIHSGPEYERHKFNVTDISLRDQAETYLYAFERLVRTTDVKEVMCAYNAIEGKPCCGQDTYLQGILRDEWGYKELVVSDCGAVRDFFNGEGTHNIFPGDGAAASANAVLAGTDVNCGASYAKLPEAVRRGAITEAQIDVAVRRLLKARFELGELDDFDLNPWNRIPADSLATAYSNSVALRIARESMTLLQNNGNTLPFRPGAGKVYAVVGPNADDSTTMWANYNGTPSHTVTVLEGIRRIVGPEDKVIFQKGSEWCVGEVFDSRFSRCWNEGGKGFTATYWNNLRQEGKPVAVTQMSTPWQLCTSGNTVFCPGVQLENFSARYTTVYHADKTERIELSMFVCGQGTAVIGTDTLSGFRTGHGPRNYIKAFRVEAGKDYPITIFFAYTIPDAQCNLDLGVKVQETPESLITKTAEADAYIYVGGISPRLEGEEMKVNFEGFKGGDRTDIELPRVQRETLRALHATGKPVVLVNMSGSAIALEPETQSCDAILQAWYGGQEGGTAVAEVLFGRYNPGGKLPVTFYHSVNDLPHFNDYHFVGHTYRYFKGEPLWAFGYGLSYTTFRFGTAKMPKTFGISDRFDITVPVTNTGKTDGDEVVQVYIRRADDEAGPTKTLRGFKRVRVAAGQTINVSIPMDVIAFRTFNDATGRLDTRAGKYYVWVGNSSREQDLKRYEITCR